MKIAIAIDSFKGSLSTTVAADAVAEAVKAVYPEAQIRCYPLADGGEGTVAAIAASTDATLYSARVCGPLGKPVSAEYAVVDGTVAVMEMSAAAGITLVAEKDRNPLKTTTRGVGELIKHAMDRGCRKFVMGIGGSATNDGGTGMLSALGYRFSDRDGKDICDGAAGLKELMHVDATNADPRLQECDFRIACDVKNPLCGDQGCSAVFGPQKGATPEMIKNMDSWLLRFAELTKEINPTASPDFPGAGAAGGMGFAALAYLGGRLESGIGLVMELNRLKAEIGEADLVITGEGRLDGQSAMGKAPVGVAAAAKKFGKPVIAFCGCVGNGAAELNEYGIDAYFPILQTPCTAEEAMDIGNARKNLRATAEQALRLYRRANKTNEEEEKSNV